MSLDLSSVATSLISNLASDTFVKLRRSTGKNFEPVDGITIGGSDVDFPLTAAVLDTSERLVSDFRVSQGDRVVIMDNKIEPKMDDLIVIPDDSGIDEVYRIVDIGGINHAGTRQFYQVVVRG